MKILVISGSYPPDVCGVGDYTFRLMSSAFAKSNDWQLYGTRGRGWGVGSFFWHIKAIRLTGLDTIIMQVPTQGYGWSVVPHFLSVYFGLFTRKRMVIRLHEYTQLSRKSRLAVNLMLFTADCVLFTNDFDKKSAVHRFNRLKSRSGIVKIFSNISASAVVRPTNIRDVDLINFGHIRPGKGIEHYIECVIQVRKVTPSIRAMLVGQISFQYIWYYEEIKPLCEQAGIEIQTDVEEQKLSELLNNAKVAYLPFPDGASERRGSLLASLCNGIVVISTEGQFISSVLRQAVTIVSPDKASDVALNLLKLPSDKLVELQRGGLEFIATQIPSSWDEVARKYIQVIEKCESL